MKVYKEWVDENGEATVYHKTDKEGFKSVKYIDVLVAKMAEKDKQIERLEKRIDQIIISISN